MKTITLELAKQDMGFSAAHFTLFSSTERERLHGHHYQVAVTLAVNIQDDGLSVDYKVYKTKIRALCQTLDEYVLLPTQSPYLKIVEEGLYLYALFNQERIPFLKSDVLLLPIRNTTVEELSNYFLEALAADPTALKRDGIQSLSVKVSSGEGQSGLTTKQLAIE